MTLPTIAFAGRSEAPDRILLILLPGADMTAQDFVDYDFIGPVRATAEAIDVLCVDSSVDLYLDNTIVDELHRLILVASHPRQKLWLAGISLGGMGALLYAKAHPGTVEGIILLSPYLGARGIVDEVEHPVALIVGAECRMRISRPIAFFCAGWPKPVTTLPNRHCIWATEQATDLSAPIRCWRVLSPQPK